MVDRLRSNGKWRNLAKAPARRGCCTPEELEDFLATHPPLEMLFHLGAISETTAIDGDVGVVGQCRAAVRGCGQWCAARQVPFVYASSASDLRGRVAEGFEDDASIAFLERLRPLNLYGWTKHAFDPARGPHAGGRGQPRPPQWAGLKIFNVSRPERVPQTRPMISVVKVKYDEVRDGFSTAPVSLGSCPSMADGAQRRDFVWVGDVVDVMLWLLDTPTACGLFNVGTGRARTYQDLAYALCRSPWAWSRRVEFIDMPEGLRSQYQSFTEAGIGRLRAAGYPGSSPRWRKRSAVMCRNI